MCLEQCHLRYFPQQYIPKLKMKFDYQIELVVFGDSNYLNLNIILFLRSMYLLRQDLGPVAPWFRPWSTSLVSPFCDNNQQPFGLEASLHVNQLHLFSFAHISWHCSALSVSNFSIRSLPPIQ